MKVSCAAVFRAGKGLCRSIKTLPDDIRNPIILPRNHPLAYLFLQRIHESRRHCSEKRLMYEARQNFWIIGLRGMAKFLMKKCVTCRKLRTRPLEQIMGQMPKLRVAGGLAAFCNTAIDMFGAFQIKLNRRTVKEVQVIILRV